MPRVFKKRDRRAVEVVAAAVVMLIMADNDRKQLKGGETESGTSSTRQPHASSLLGPFAFILRHVHLGQLASERQNPGMSTLDSVCLSFDQNSRNRGIESRKGSIKKKKYKNKYKSVKQ